METDVGSPGSWGEGRVVDPGEIIGKARGDRERDDLREGIRVEGSHQGLHLRKEFRASLPNEQYLSFVLDFPLPPEKGPHGWNDVDARGKTLLQQGSGNSFPLLGRSSGDEKDNVLARPFEF